jgi:hypothetical protein
MAALRTGVLIAFAPVYLPWVVPYYIAKASVNVALFPARAVYHGLTDKDDTDG